MTYHRLTIRSLLLSILFAINIPAYCCAVLVYHHFDTTTPPSTSIDPKLFEQHLEYLDSHNFSVLSVKELIYRLNTQTPLPDKCAVLTTDDAYISIYTHAYPLLQQYNMPMSVFVATDVIDKQYGAYLTYKEMKQMQPLVSFYNHSKDHAYLHTLSKEEVKNNITHAENRLRNELGVTEKIFAYPYGEYSKDTIAVLKDLGYVAFAQHSGAIGLGSNRYALPRFPMTNVYGKMSSFKTKVHTLALPLQSATEHHITADNPPTLTLETQSNIKLNCFVNGLPIENITRSQHTYTITASAPLPLGRNKYNCTAASGQKDRFYWYSHQWLIRE